jgi:catechol 2,3-dioxygenase-like lactoylglutathione lyase family enzyme
MAHRILLREVVIDVPTRDLETATSFWAAALATEAHPLKDYAEFVALQNPAARCVVGLQDVGDAPARFHVDIESDDVEAEVARLIALGATEVSRQRSWVVLRDPAGLLLCVVPPDTPDFARHARTVE